MPTVPTQKIVVLGEGRVGKTSLSLRFVNGIFSATQPSTQNASLLEKEVTVGGTHRVNLQICDTAGQERFHALAPIYYRDAQGAVLVYDITDADSFKRVERWVQELRHINGDVTALVLVGNKLDLQHQRKVQKKDAEDYAKKVGAAHIQASAKQGQGVEEVFFELARRMDTLSTTKGSKMGDVRKTLIAPSDDGQRQQSGGCCK